MAVLQDFGSLSFGSMSKQRKQGLPRRTAERFLARWPGTVRFPVVSHVGINGRKNHEAYRQSRTALV